ncbi:MAG: 23S rRNA (uracil(1939)-C(5))-methyltransferase RlmD [Chitinophagales bacterium]
MGRRRYRGKPKVLKDLEITAIAPEGKAIARHEGKVIFVDDAVPGDVADVFISRNKKDYAIGRVDVLKTASPDRIEPFCAHFDLCGGCKWQYMAYDKQLEYKQQIVQEAFERVGKLTFPPLLPILGGEPNQYYRNKLDYTFTNRRWLSRAQINSDEKFERNAVGFHSPGAFDRVIDVTHCYLQAEPSNAIRNEVRRYALEHGLTFYDVKSKVGFLRNLIIRSSTLDEWMVILSVGEANDEALFPLLDHLAETFPQITALQYVVNTKRNETLYDLDIITHKGRDHIYETLEDLKYKISPKSFFQTNPYQAVRLYQTVREFADLQGEETVYDLYTGTGSIGIFLAKHCKKVVGIEEVEPAIVDAKFNAELNDLDNTAFYAGDVKAMLGQEFVAQNGTPDLLVTDPPRAGMHPDVVMELLKMQPPRIVYVSCNPVTQARDLQLLSEKYEIKKVQPVDMFPHTYHVENVVLLALKD